MSVKKYYRILKFYLRFSQSSKWSKEKITSYQDDKLIKLVRHAAENVPYYRNLFKEINFDVTSFRGTKDMHKIPLLDKEIVRTHYNDLIAENASKYGIHHETTSGSTGTPLKLILDDRTESMQTSCIIRTYTWAKYKLYKKSFGLQSYLKYNYTGMEGLVYDRKINTYRFDSNKLNKENAVKIAKQLLTVKPKFYFGYPLPLTMLGLFAKEESIKMHSPESMIVYGESLSSERKALLESLYNTQIFNFYSMHERSAVISTCRNHRLHAMEDFAFNEVIDEQGNTINEGIGELVGTNLYNFSMPLIRYKTRDIVEVESSDNTVCGCGCNFRIFKQIIGRQNDYIRTPDGRVLGNVMEHAIDKSKGIVLSQCVQDKLNHIYLNLVVDESYDPQSLENITAALRKRIGNEIEIEFKFVKELEKTNGGKTPFILSKLGNNYI